MALQKSYNFTLVIIDWLTKMIYYKPIKITINTPELAKVILNVVVWYYDLFNLIIFDKSLLFTFKFWLLLCYFFGIKQKLFIVFYS